MEELLQQQKKAIGKLNQWVERFEKNPEGYVVRKCKDVLLKLEQWLQAFNKCNSELVPYTTQDQPYFVEDKYSAPLQKYCLFMTKLQGQVNLDETHPSQRSLDEEVQSISDDDDLTSDSEESEPNEILQEEVQAKLDALKLQRNDVKKCNYGN